MTTRILLDPGHGGSDPGVTWPLVAHSDTFDLIEKNLTLSIGLQLRKALLGMGWDLDVLMTREQDEDLSLAGRGRVAEDQGTDLVLSLHVNSNPRPEVNGAMAFYWPGNGPGRAVAACIMRCMPDELRRIHAIAWEATNEPGADDDWLKRSRNVLGSFRPTAVLVEMGHATNADDRREMLLPAVQRGIVAACVCGVARFLSTTQVKVA